MGKSIFGLVAGVGRPLLRANWPKNFLVELALGLFALASEMRRKRRLKARVRASLRGGGTISCTFLPAECPSKTGLGPRKLLLGRAV